MGFHVQGFISHEEFQSIPELSINPLHTRMGQVFNHVNFKVLTTPFTSPDPLHRQIIMDSQHA